MSNNSNLVGKVVFLARKTPTKDHSTYHDGEFLVTQATPTTLYGTPYKPRFSVYDLGGGFSGDRGKPLVGPGAYEILETFTPNVPQLLESLLAVEVDCNDVLAGKKKRNWVESVYSDALATCAQIRRRLAPIQANVRPSAISYAPARLIDGQLRIAVPLGVKSIHVDLEARS